MLVELVPQYGIVDTNELPLVLSESHDYRGPAKKYSNQVDAFAALVALTEHKAQALI